MNTLINKKALLILAVIAVLFTQCKSKETPKEPATESEANKEPGDEVILTEKQYQHAGITLGKIEEKPMTGTIKVNGKLDVPPQNMVTISMPYGGLVKNTELLQGMYIRKGSVLATLENADYIQMQQDYAEAVYQLGFLKSEYQRQKELQAENINATKTYQKAVSDYETMRVRAEALRQKLLLIGIDPANAVKGNMTRTVNILAPIDGYVTKVMVNRGKYVQANDVLFELVDTRHTHCELFVFEKDIQQIHVGDKVTFRLANETKDREAQVHLVGKEIAEDRTVQVHCHMLQEDPSLLPGSFLTALVHADKVMASTLPDAAIMRGADQQFVYLLDKKSSGKNEDGIGEARYHFRQIPVRAGLSADGFTQVYLPENTDPQATFATAGAFSIYSKMNNVEGE